MISSAIELSETTRISQFCGINSTNFAGDKYAKVYVN